MKRRLFGVACVLAIALGIGVAPSLAQGPYVQVDYMKVAPGKDQAYVDMERNVWKPYHQALVDAGQHAWWGLYAIRSPAGSEVGFSYATVNVFSKLTDMESPFSEEILRKVYPGKDINAFGNEALATRGLVRSEINSTMLADFVRDAPTSASRSTSSTTRRARPGSPTGFPHPRAPSPS